MVIGKEEGYRIEELPRCILVCRGEGDDLQDREDVEASRKEDGRDVEGRNKGHAGYTLPLSTREALKALRNRTL